MRGDTVYRPSIDLCGLWRAQPDPAWEGEQAGWSDVDHDDRRWREVRLPNCFDVLYDGLEAYEGAVWFRRQVVVPAEWRDRRVLIRFEAVNQHAKVWVNGECVGEHEDGFLPFAFPVHGVLAYGAQNTIVVCADNVRRPGEVPGLQRGWRTVGGILREVSLVATDPLHIADVRVTAVPATEGGRLSVRLEVRNEQSQTVETALLLRVLDGEGGVLATWETAARRIGAHGVHTQALRGVVDRARSWSPAEPALYRADVELRLQGKAVDRQVESFGFRRIEAREGVLLLNGQPVFLTGFNRHEDSAERYMATDLDTVRRDLLDMKAAGANFLRLCHYPHHPGELDLCDELGMLAMCEVPLYWWDGCAEGEEACRAKLEAAERQLRKLVRRDANHPSVVLWSVSNENHEDRPEVAAGNQQLVQLAKELDPTRLAAHVSDHWRSHPNFSQDDVVCVNGYPSLDAHLSGGEAAYDLSTSTRFWREGLQALHERYPDKPVLVSEFGHTALQGVHGGTFAEGAQAAAIEHEFAGMGAPYVCGATVWCWADHPWPAATFGYCNYLATSPYGVVTRHRRRLEAYWTVRRLFRARQGIAEVERRATPSAAGYELFMVRPHMGGIPQVPFPEGFGIRPLHLDEGGLWLDIQRDAEPHFPIEDHLYVQEFAHDLQATQWRSYLVTNEKGVGVGVISAWYNRDFRGQDYGQVHWVAIRPAYQGRGLGKAALSFTLNQLAQWHERCYLGTQSKRIPAIRLYLNFGFLPHLDAPGAIEGWREVRQAVRHPALQSMAGL